MADTHDDKSRGLFTIAAELSAEADRLESENVYSAQGITRDWLRGLAVDTLKAASTPSHVVPQCESKLDDGDAEWPCAKCGAGTPDHCHDLGRSAPSTIEPCTLDKYKSTHGKTPRTDAFLKALDQRSPYSSHMDYLDLKEHARQLERKLAEANKCRQIAEEATPNAFAEGRAYAAAEIVRLERELACADAFHRVAVQQRDAARSATVFIEPTDAQIAAFEKSWNEITMPARGGRKRITDALRAMHAADAGKQS